MGDNFMKSKVICMICLALAGFSGTAGADISTLAVFPFENNCGARKTQYEDMGKSISVMLMTELSQTKSPFRLVDRDRIQTLIEELEFSRSAYVDQSTAIRMGKMLGARFIAFGSFMVIGRTLRIDARIIRVETGTLLFAEDVSGHREQVIPIVESLARKIAERGASLN